MKNIYLPVFLVGALLVGFYGAFVARFVPCQPTPATSTIPVPYYVVVSLTSNGEPVLTNYRDDIGAALNAAYNLAPTSTDAESGDYQYDKFDILASDYTGDRSLLWNDPVPQVAPASPIGETMTDCPRGGCKETLILACNSQGICHNRSLPTSTPQVTEWSCWYPEAFLSGLPGDNTPIQEIVTTTPEETLADLGLPRSNCTQIK